MDMRPIPFPAFVAAALSFLLFPAGSVAADSDPTPGVPEWVEAEFVVAGSSLLKSDLLAKFSAHKLTISGSTLTADGARARYDALRDVGGEAAGDEFIAAIEAQMRARARAVLANAFPDAESRELVSVVLNRASLSDSGDDDPYHPALVIDATSKVVLSRAKLGIGELTDEAVSAAFAAGARIDLPFRLFADPGYNSSFTLRPPPGLSFASPSEGGLLLADGKSARFAVSNWRGPAVTSSSEHVEIRDPSAQPPSGERVTTTIRLEILDFTANEAHELPVRATIESRLHALSLAKELPGALPSKVKLEYVAADAVRAFWATGALSQSRLASAEARLLRSVADNLTSSLRSQPTVEGGFVSGTFPAVEPPRPFAEDPPLVYQAVATGGYRDSRLDEDDAEAALDAGATIGFDVALFRDENRELRFEIVLPEGAEFASASGGSVSPDGRTLVVTQGRVSEGAAASSIRLEIRGEDAVQFTAESASVEIVVDLKDIDISVAGAAGGDFGNLVVDLRVKGHLGVIRVPEALKGRLPEGVKLDYLSADGIRRLLEEGTVERNEIGRIEAQLLENVTARLSSALGGSVKVSGGFEPRTLVGQSSDPLQPDPILFEAVASVVKPLQGGPARPADAQAAITLYRTEQSFVLPRFQTFDTTYKFLLPRGISVGDVSVTGGERSTGEEGGREYFTVKPTGESAQTRVQMALTPTFVWIKFWPIVLAAIALLVLLIAGPTVAIVAARRRRRARSAAGKGAPEAKPPQSPPRPGGGR